MFFVFSYATRQNKSLNDSCKIFPQPLRFVNSVNCLRHSVFTSYVRKECVMLCKAAFQGQLRTTVLEVTQLSFLRRFLLFFSNTSYSLTQKRNSSCFFVFVFIISILSLLKKVQITRDIWTLCQFARDCLTNEVKESALGQWTSSVSCLGVRNIKGQLIFVKRAESPGVVVFRGI